MIDLRGYLRPLGPASFKPDRTATGPAGPLRRTEWPRLPDRAEHTDPVLIRARLGRYQRALTSARKTLHHPVPDFRPSGASLFTTHSDGGAHQGSAAQQGGDQ
ncbi:hypothetical protein [Kineosporia babensis]|uniref:Uncharacterized protein n=1 Tax=Kineosporia babensis TaxID=499548 RepID=A0A9X1SSR3_9ACTN|nr:hypothetical protein [Kineosporia babensis]MCD5310586.1 hypothetical protein [Kineosporia babensis]